MPGLPPVERFAAEDEAAGMIISSSKPEAIIIDCKKVDSLLWVRGAFLPHPSDASLGKKFKMFDKIIPSLELDITDLLSEGPQQCIMCGHVAVEECPDCFKDSIFSPTGFKVFCKNCSAQVHSHPQRRSHQPATLEIPKGYLGRGIPHSLTRDRLELFAVLCIETSHYVSFVKHGPSNTDWIFFDSMADREGERDGFNIPEVQACPEVGMYLEMSPAELANQVPRDMKGVAKRLFCDAYMYLYQSTSMCLYR
ncbi:ubiquitin carboxyl-terminal hydrolase CYLD-like [Fundulus heteroclitus]|uniref:ubiquitin carboxyl-terminal hydrolase CYLD-like n=1 Tax=Fundulus heteroclitus TaxID=8078 RepID=UPI00165C0C9D|nr:ubiquitin carboxyl-terminal hydrolase CYLD-like [Fundulus heteroclitus]